MEAAFNQQNKVFFEQLQDRKCLVGVSGGVDSMVLLELLLAHPLVRKEQLIIGHFNHGLRTAAADEEAALRSYCVGKGLQFHVGNWDPTGVTSNIESQAREARYAFFEKIAKAEKTSYLLTAHHQDDLAETVLMKLITGSRLDNLVGIRQLSQWGSLKIVRLLLDFSKKDLQSFAERRKLVYWEDGSNQDDRFKRNRLRHQVLPLLKAENPQVLDQVSHFVKQLTYATEIIDDYRDNWRDRITKEEHGWVMDLTGVPTLTESERYFLLDTLFQETVIPQGVKLNRRQMATITGLLLKDNPSWQFDLGQGWRLQQSYELLELKQWTPVIARDTTMLDLGLTQLPQGYFVLEKMTPGLADADLLGECLFTLNLSADQLPLKVRAPKTGDQIVFNQLGQHKKVNRLFIDKKIPREKRANYLVLEDNNKQILSLFHGEESYLSIRQETDRIHYRLTYFAKK